MDTQRSRRVRAPGDFWKMATMHSALGFQRSFFEDSYRLRERIGPWLSDREFFTQTVPTLRTQPTPFMAFLLTASNHHPYRLPAQDKELHSENWRVPGWETIFSQCVISIAPSASSWTSCGRPGC